MATNAKNLAYLLLLFWQACKDIFLFNHTCSTSITYDLLEGIKDECKVSAKYDTKGLMFKTANTVIVFSNGFSRTEALERDRWKVYEINWCEKYLEWLRNGQLCIVTLGKNTDLLVNWNLYLLMEKNEITTLASQRSQQKFQMVAKMSRFWCRVRKNVTGWTKWYPWA